MTSRIYNSDKIENFAGALIQHGPHNNRIYLMKHGSASPASLAKRLIDKAKKHGYTKIFAKVPASCSTFFLQIGYETEARIPGFFKGMEDCFFLAFYIEESRRISKIKKEEEKALDFAAASSTRTSAKMPLLYNARKLGPADISNLSALYALIFPNYPFPIQDMRYIEETMGHGVEYFGIEMSGSIVAASSAEMDVENQSVEMTDFATLKNWRGRSFSRILLNFMEKNMQECGMKTSYTIARSLSLGMNKTFAANGYNFNGKLVNNTNISSGIESMNVWSKPLT